MIDWVDVGGDESGSYVNNIDGRRDRSRWWVCSWFILLIVVCWWWCVVGVVFIVDRFMNVSYGINRWIVLFVGFDIDILWGFWLWWNGGGIRLMGWFGVIF